MGKAGNQRPGRFQARARRYLVALAGAAVLLAGTASPALSSVQATSATARMVTVAAPASVPGMPGTPQAPAAIYSEGFENGQGTIPARLTRYRGVSGESYTADPAWLQDCNGWIAAFEDPAGDSPLVKSETADCTPKEGVPGAPGPTAWDKVRGLAQALGVLNGSADADANHAVSAYTNGPVSNGDPGAGKVEFRTVRPIPLPENGRFLTFSVNAAEINCNSNSNHALLNFFLVNGATSIPVSSQPIDPCTAGTVVTPGIFAGTFRGDSPVLFLGHTLGVRLVNGQGSGVGNDHAFDDVRVLDVTPQLDKSFSPRVAQAGGTSTLTFTITNTADLLPKAGWSFTDTLPAGLALATPAAATTTCPAGTVTAADGGTAVALAGGALNQGQASCTVSVKVTSAMTGTYVNYASDITASTGLNPPGSTSIRFTDGPQVSVVKSVSPSWFSAAGQTLSYSFQVTNPSAVPLTGITVNDTGPAGLSAVNCPQAALAPGASETCTATYVTTPADLRAGSVTNTATATGTPLAGPAVTSDPSSATVPSVAGALTLRKTATPASFSAAGQLITFHLLVTNTSTVTMSAITASDNTTTVNNVRCPARPQLTAPSRHWGRGESEQCTVTYLTTAADVDAGGIRNAAIARGDPPGSVTPVESNESDVTDPAARQPAITVAKTASPVMFDRAGQVIKYTFLITNTGNVTLTRVHAVDRLPGLSAVRCPGTALAAGAAESCTAEYRVTQADLTAGFVTNSATAQGDPPGSRGPVVSPVSTARALAVVPVTG